jgi:hypothetical protein
MRDLLPRKWKVHASVYIFSLTISFLFFEYTDLILTLNLLYFLTVWEVFLELISLDSSKEIFYVISKTEILIPVSQMKNMAVTKVKWLSCKTHFRLDSELCLSREAFVLGVCLPHWNEGSLRLCCSQLQPLNVDYALALISCSMITLK